MVDLHMHSICSDGSDNIEELINNVIVAGIDLFALTDHDTAEGCRQIFRNEYLQKLIKDNNVKFISGAEWTALYKNQKMHILAYDFDPFDDEIFRLEKEMHVKLEKKDEFRIGELKRNGYNFSNKSIEYLKNKENVRTLDFARCLVNDGWFDDVQIAANFLIHKIKYPHQCRFDAIELLKTLKSLGATIIWAHSIYDVKKEYTSFERVEEIVKELKPYGLDGLECYYSLYKKDEINKLIEVAHFF